MAGEKLRAAPSKIIINGELHSFDDLTAEKKKECIGKMMDNIGRTMGDYFRSRPEELAEFVKQSGVTVTPK